MNAKLLNDFPKEHRRVHELKLSSSRRFTSVPGERSGNQLCAESRELSLPEIRILIRPAMSNAAYFFSSTTTVWISAFPVFSTASNSASRHHASPAFLFIAIVFPSDPVSLPMAGVIA